MMTRPRTHRLHSTLALALLGALGGAAWAEGGPTPPTAAAAPTPASPRGQIRVEITGLENTKGKVRCAVFAQAKGWPTEDAAARARTTVGIRKSGAGLRAWENFGLSRAF
jgi:uncharacterized protein (DUF2141 family)